MADATPEGHGKRLSLPNTGATDDSKPYFIERINEIRARKFNVEEVTFRAKFNDDLQGRKLLDITNDLHNMFDDIMENVATTHKDPNDKARLSIRHDGLEREIFIHCQPQHNITADVIMERLVKLLVSYEVMTF